MLVIALFLLIESKLNHNTTSVFAQS